MSFFYLSGPRGIGTVDDAIIKFSIKMSTHESILISLSDDQLKKVFEPLKEAYSDFPQFQELVETRLQLAIAEAENINISLGTSKKIAERYYPRELYRTFGTAAWKNIKLIFRAAYVLILYHRVLLKQEKSAMTKAKRIRNTILWHSTAQLLQGYPHFADVGAEELDLLLKFRNMVRVAVMFITAKLNKQLIINIAGRLEGSQCSYITGGGQRSEVSRRVEIYEKEGKVVPEKRPYRILAALKLRAESEDTDVQDAPPVKRSRSNSSELSSAASSLAASVPQLSSSSSSCSYSYSTSVSRTRLQRAHPDRDATGLFSVNLEKDSADGDNKAGFLRPTATASTPLASTRRRAATKGTAKATVASFQNSVLTTTSASITTASTTRSNTSNYGLQPLPTTEVSQGYRTIPLSPSINIPAEWDSYEISLLRAPVFSDPELDLTPQAVQTLALGHKQARVPSGRTVRNVFQ